QEEAGAGARIAWQAFAVRPPVHAVVRLLDGLFGREGLLAGSGGSADTKESGQLGDLPSGAAMEQEVSEQTRGIVVGALGVAEAEGGLEDGALLVGEACLGNLCLGQPGGKGIRCGR